MTPPEVGSTSSPITPPEAVPVDRVPPRGRDWRGTIGRVVVPFLPALVFLAFWEWASGRLIRELYVSRPSAIAARLVELGASAELWHNLAVTGEELVLGYGIGVLLGAATGYALGRSPGLARVFEPYVMAFYSVPKIALAPLFIIWFGIGIGSKVALAGLMVFFLIFFNVFMGVRAIDRQLIDLARIMGAGQTQLTRHVYLPASTPFLIMGMRMALPYSVIGVIVGEFTASTEGLGLFIHEASASYDPAGVFAGIAILLGFVLAANFAAGRLEARLLRWQPTRDRGAVSL
ncbi:MAG TPA: ABC transporter permease [Stellaceae bacterium]|nr:ABC transporter permease [Stellaceae bacterium]